jgi:hypothetical protein
MRLRVSNSGNPAYPEPVQRLRRTREVIVPLSEHEQRLLEQMERALYAEDPKFATSMRNPRTMAGDRRRVALGVVAFLIGIGMLLAGVATQIVLIGVAGFLAMLAGIWLAVVGLRPGPQAGQAGQPGHAASGGPTAPRAGRPSRAKQRRGESLTERMEERWRRRRETGDF